jgi:uncharacterized membrane protein YobD (UPF0266 family)
MTPEAEGDAIHRFISIQTRGDDEIKGEALIALLLKRRRRFITMILINVLAVLFFGYSYHAGISSLPGWVLAGVGVTFVLNMGIIARQLHWAGKAISYVKAGQAG